MKAFLMFRDKNFDVNMKLPWNAEHLLKDLELDTILDSMSIGDKFIREVSSKVLLSGSKDMRTILYRQDVLKDALKNAGIVRKIYGILVNAILEAKKQYFWISHSNPEFILRESIAILTIYLNALQRLRDLAIQISGNFQSEGFVSLLSLMQEEFNEQYVEIVRKHLASLRFTNGVIVRGELGKGNILTNYMLLKPTGRKWRLPSVLNPRNDHHYTYILPERDETGAQSLTEMRIRGILSVSSILGDSAENVLNFLNGLKAELAFYIGCINLHDQISQIGSLLCFPQLGETGDSNLKFQELYDLSLSLRLKGKVVGNNIDSNEADLIIITGANRGGKSTFLRSLGQAQLLMQCGAFVPAESFQYGICNDLFTHFKKEEDPSMNMGKLDEELSRMNDIVGHLTPSCMVLFNESFASTNAREGSEVARQVIDALLEKGIRIAFVTHLYELAQIYMERKKSRTAFLRAERKEDGSRTFKIVSGEPLKTSYGKDLYFSIFNTQNGTGSLEEEAASPRLL